MASDDTNDMRGGGNVTKRRITILGMGPSAHERRHDIARYCEGTEIWSLNNAYGTFPKLAKAKAFARYFELHSWQYLSKWEAGKTTDGKIVDHWGNLEALGCPIVTGQRMPFVTRQELVDWTALGAHFHAQLFGRLAVTGDTETHRLALYSMGSPSLMVALALYEHDTGKPVEYIQSWGIDTSDPQHLGQRAAWSFWISQALSRGIEIGGTAAAYMFAHEEDAGLQGLRELITEKVTPTPKEVPL